MEQLQMLQDNCASSSLQVTRQATGSNKVSALHVAAGQLRLLVVIHKTRILLESGDENVSTHEWLCEPASAVGLQQLIGMLRAAAAAEFAHL